ncbi:MAG: hypothetical protein WBF35_05000 [Candidatus Acidiferrales bacterium]
MPVQRIQVGQLWKKDGTDETYLVTRLYTEALTTIAVLRRSGAEKEALVRVRVERSAKGQTLPGFNVSQAGE